MGSKIVGSWQMKIGTGSICRLRSLLQIPLLISIKLLRINWQEVNDCMAFQPSFSFQGLFEREFSTSGQILIVLEARIGALEVRLEDHCGACDARMGGLMDDLKTFVESLKTKLVALQEDMALVKRATLWARWMLEL
ncbi:hypothetical protein AMTR_s00013p00163890, partial [Amborella trichopoda]